MEHWRFNQTKNRKKKKKGPKKRIPVARLILEYFNTFTHSRPRLYGPDIFTHFKH